ncbi:MAG: hypothetical protein ACRET1_05215 [Burkholderiales bacterium]
MLQEKSARPVRRSVRADLLFLPPLKKEGTGDFLAIALAINRSKSPSIPLFQRGKYRGFCLFSPPFVKGGQGGFYGDCAGDQPFEIPLNPPFSKGEALSVEAS